jgi:DNA-binding transcriptional regulator YdaS (Cro superfamily)
MAMSLPEWLRKHNESQTAFAARAGVSDAAVSGWVAGKHCPDIESASRVERATDGAVPVSIWARRDRRRRKSAHKAPKQAS